MNVNASSIPLQNPESLGELLALASLKTITLWKAGQRWTLKLARKR
jgi:hypothetical protein